MNLLSETLDKMTEVKKTPEDVVEVQWTRVVTQKRVAYGYAAVVETFGTTWERFASAIAHVEYDNGYGAQEINYSLKVVFKDASWMERLEYDGMESWEYKHSPKPAKNNTINRKDILLHVWEDPCSHCSYTGSWEHCNGCGSSYSFRHWEEK